MKSRRKKFINIQFYRSGDTKLLEKEVQSVKERERNEKLKLSRREIMVGKRRKDESKGKEKKK